MARPPLSDFFDYLDGSLTGDRLSGFEHYLSRNREASRRLKQMARVESSLRDALIVESILADAKQNPPPSGPRRDLDETLVAAWVDGALTKSERLHLMERLETAPGAVEYLRDAKTAIQSQRDFQAGAREAGRESPAPVPVAAEQRDVDAPTRSRHQRDPMRDSTLDMIGVVTQQAAEARGEGRDAERALWARTWLGRLLLQTSKGVVAVLDTAPRNPVGPAVRKDAVGRQVMRMPFPGFRLEIGVVPAFCGAVMELAAEGDGRLPAQFVVTDEHGRRIHRVDRVAGNPSALPPLRPGFYRLMAPPTPLNVAIGVNGELGTTEVYVLHQGE